MSDTADAAPHTPPKRETRKEKLARRLTEIQNQLKDLAAAEKEANRKAEARRLILWGRILSSDMEDNPESESTKRFREIADRYYPKSDDRKLLGLKPLPITEGRGKDTPSDTSSAQT